MSTNTKGKEIKVKENSYVNDNKTYEKERKNAVANKLKYYEAERSALSQSERSQQKIASVTLDKLQKYLPYQLKAQGLSNNGASESALIQAHNDYMNSMSDISANVNAERAALERYKQQDIDAINEKYDEKRELEKEKISAESSDNLLLLNEKVTELLNKYQDDNGMLSSAEKAEIENYIENHSTLLTDADKRKLYMALDGHTATDETTQNSIDAAQVRSDNLGNVVKLAGNSNTANSGLGDNFKVKVGDEVYKVEKGKDVTDAKTRAALFERFGGTPAIGSTVVYDGKLYIFLENKDIGRNNWCLVQGRNFNDSSFRELCDAIGIAPYERN